MYSSGSTDGKGSIPMKVLVVDDHALVRDALLGALKDLKEVGTVLEASDGRQAMLFAREHPDLCLILLDLRLPDRDGFAVLAELREHHPSIAIVVLSGFDDRTNVVRALELGAVGFIPKTAHRNIMLKALQLVLVGGTYIPPEILPRSNSLPLVEGVARPAASPTDLGLTERQIEVLALLMLGKSNKAISRELDLAEPTVKAHVTAILRALKVSNRTEAVLAVGALGWVLPPMSRDS
jgi:DNA-binding NarL/FixJ family response regulator